MADEKYTFEQARVRLEEIVVQVRKRDLSLEKSIELLEEGVRLANQCTELSDHTEWRTVAEEQQAAADPAEPVAEAPDEDPAPEAAIDNAEDPDRRSGPEDAGKPQEGGESDQPEEPDGPEGPVGPPAAGE